MSEIRNQRGSGYIHVLMSVSARGLRAKFPRMIRCGEGTEVR